MFRWFETRIDPFQAFDEGQPPGKLLPFIWHYTVQVWPAFAAVLVIGLFAALIEVSLFAFLGKLVDLMQSATSPSSFFSDHGTLLMWMAFVAVVLRPVLFSLHVLVVNQVIIANVTGLIRWQTHKYVLRQSLSFFQNDFAGRIANKIMQTGPSLRESVVQIVDALWFVIIYTVSALLLFSQNDPRLMVPLILWMAAFVTVLIIFVPRIKDQSKVLSETRSTLTGRIVDSYSNILTAKLFSHTEREDQYAGDAIAEMTSEFRTQLRLITKMESAIWVINGLLITGTCGLALLLWSQGAISLGAIAFATGLVIRINNMAAWIMWVITGIFENIGTVQEGMETISKPHTVVDIPEAQPLKVSQGEICYEHVRFAYDDNNAVIPDLSLTIAPGERIGIVGPSGAGKSTLVSLLLRFHDLNSGRIMIDQQDIASVQQHSLRFHIGMVTQDSSLMHRSVMDNIRYGRPEADTASAIEAAKKAHAHEFILGLQDLDGRTAYEAHVGERGVKLSGGQRQRIAIARVLLKDAPILLLDEATSSLDSGIEAAIQEQFYNLMEGKTVIAIAHRLSTIAAMDRLVVMDQGRIVEQGNHDTLIQEDGLYAQLWRHQSGGFLGKD